MKNSLQTVPMSILLCVSLICLPASAIAHDGWVESAPAIVEIGQPVSLLLMHGNHSNGHGSYRLAGKWDSKLTRVAIVSPHGTEEDVTERVVDLGEDPEKTGPKGPKGFHVASFTPREEGVYLVRVTQRRTLQHGDGPKFLSVRTAKTAFAALPAPTLSAAAKLNGFDRAVGGDDALEIVPLAGPAGAVLGKPIALEVRYKGKPAPGKTVTLVARIGGAASAQDQTTDENGRVTFHAGAADHHLARVKFDEQGEKAEGRYEKSTYEATYVFQVFNRPQEFAQPR
jgi:uncharacterized GH25 family protein